MTSIICLFELVHLNDLLCDEWVDHVVKEVNVQEVLKSSIFVVQKAAAPKNGVEFRQGSNGTIRSSLATSYDVARCHCISTNQNPGAGWVGLSKENLEPTLALQSSAWIPNPSSSRVWQYRVNAFMVLLNVQDPPSQAG